MIRILLGLVLLKALPLSAAAFDLTAPSVPQSGNFYMPKDLTSFGDAITELLKNCMHTLLPDYSHIAAIGISLIFVAVMLSIVKHVSQNERKILDIAGTTAVSVMLVGSNGSLIDLAAETILTLSDYGKLFFPVMTAAMAAQGSITTSASLYIGTCIFDSVLSSLLSGLLLPSVYLFIAMSVTYAAIHDESMKHICDLIKNATVWCLKILLTVFTSYMSITGAVSGATDAATLKATKLTISTAVPIVGGILSDASEAVLVSAGLMKNTAGVYGIFAFLAIFLEPFLRIAFHYWVLKMSSAICNVLGCKQIALLTEYFSSAMGMLLAMTASMCMLLLVSTVCFMKGIG